MKRLTSAVALSLCLLTGATAVHATPSAMTVPTTKILAIGTLTGPLSPADAKTIMPQEVRQTVALYLDGKIDQWWFRQDGSGVVFLLNVTSTQEAEDMLEKLPLGVAKRMTFQLMPLGPLNPLHILLPPQPDAATGKTLHGPDGSDAR